MPPSPCQRLLLLASMVSMFVALPTTAQVVGLSTWAEVDAKAYGGLRCFDDHTGAASAIATCSSDSSSADTNGRAETFAAYGRLSVLAGAFAQVHTSDGGGTNVYASASFVDRLAVNGLSPSTSYQVTLVAPVSGGLLGNGFLESGCTVRANLALGGAPQSTNGGPSMHDCTLQFTTTGDVLHSGFFVTAELGVHVGAGGAQPGPYDAVADYSHTMLLSGFTLADPVSGAVVSPQSYALASASGTVYPVPVPEPARAALLAAGLAVLGAIARRRASPRR